MITTINVWDFQDIDGNIMITCTDGQTIRGKIGDIVDAGEEAEDYGYEEDSITVYSGGKVVTIPQSEIKSIETL